MNNIFLTGSHGYIGSRLYLKLLSNKFEKNIEECDLKIGRDVLSYEPKKNIDIIYHLAAQSGVPESIDDPKNDARQNILGTIKMIELANKQKSKLIFVSSGATKGIAESPYGLSKQTCEKYIKMLCNNYVILRFSSIYGEKPKGVVDNFIRSNKCIIYGNGEQTRDFVHIEDIINSLIIAKDINCGIYECGSGKGVKIIDIAKATGKKIEYLPKRKGDKKEVILKNELPNWKPKINVINYIKEKCKI